MIDLVQLQDDLFGLLMSCPSLSTVNIVQERKFLTQSEINLDTVWSTVRNNRSGTGILIEMPTVEVPGKQTPGPQQSIRPSFVVFQNGDAALTPDTGSGLYAETICQLVLDALHMEELQGIGTLYAIDRTIEPARDYNFINAYRVFLFLKNAAANQTQRCAPVTITNNAGTITLACATSGAEIWFTQDGSFPTHSRAVDPVSDATINLSSTLYTAPFVVAVGTVIRATAYATGCNNGQVAKTTTT